MTKSLLVTNDFPPKVGGIQSYLWELWQRLDPASTAVLTARSDPGYRPFDEEQRARGLRITRVRAPILYFPTPSALHRIRRQCALEGARLVLLDPVWPLGLLGPRLGIPFGLVLHGAELAVPGRLPLVRAGLPTALRRASLVISAGGYPRREAERLAGGPLANVVEIPPGVDSARYRSADRADARSALGLDPDRLVVASVSRLVPRKGMDVLIRAAARLRTHRPELLVLIAGAGRDEGRLRRLIARTGAPVRLLGQVSEVEKVRLLCASDVFALVCRNRWGGLEQEGFGIVFLEAAAAGLPALAGESGGSAEAVLNGETGIVVAESRSDVAVAEALDRLLGDRVLRERMGAAARGRAQSCFDYDTLAPRLADALARVGG